MIYTWNYRCWRIDVKIEFIHVLNIGKLFAVFIKNVGFVISMIKRV